MRQPRLRLPLLLFAVLLAARALFPDADPPGNVHYHFITDEGGWAHNARLHFLLGRWVVDEDAVPLAAAPLYTVTLRAIYGRLGSGLAQTRLPSSLGGFLTCVLIYAFVRRQRDERTAILASWFFGGNYFVLTHHRVAFVEGFLLLLLCGAFFAAVLALRRWPWGVVSAVLFLLACAAKVWALGVVAILGLFWLGAWGVARFGEQRHGFSWRGLLAFTGVLAAVVVGVVATSGFHVGMVLEAVGQWWGRVTLTASTDFRPVSFGLLGLTKDVGGRLTLRVDGFASLGAVGLVRQAPLLLALTGWLAARRFAAGAWRRFDALTLLCWCWLLGGLALVAVQEYQPDRRFLFLVPPLAILVADAVARRRLRWPSAADFGPAAPWMRRLATAAILAGWIGLMGRAPLAELLHRASAGIAIGARPGLTPAAAGGLAWILVVVAGVLLLPALGRWLPARPRELSAGAVVVLFTAGHLLAVGLHLARPTFTLRDTSRQLAAWTADWPAEQRVIAGSQSDTLALETELRPINIRPWDNAGVFMNEHRWPEAWLVVGQEPPVAGFRRLDDLELAPDRRGEPRFRLPLYVRDSASF